MKRGGGAGIAYTDSRWTQINSYSSIVDDRIFMLLKKILSNGQMTEREWKKSIGKNRSKLTERLHQAASRVLLPEFKTQAVIEVHPRPEVIEFKKEMGIGNNLITEGKIVEARSFLADQIQKCPIDPIRYTNFANMCLKLKDFSTAWSAIAQAWRLAPQSLYVLNAMTDYFFATGDYAQAEKTCLLAAAQGDHEPVSIAILALSQFKLGKNKEARDTAQPLLSRLSAKDLENPIFRELLDQ